MKGIAGKVAMITGGGTGIGAACVERLAKEGAKVACCYNKSKANAEALTERLGIPAEEKNIELYDAYHADEAFYTSTGFSMLPCTKVNGLDIGDGRPGEMFQRLIDEFSEDVGVDIIAQTKAFAAEVAAKVGDLSGVDAYRFGKKSTD